VRARTLAALACIAFAAAAATAGAHDTAGRGLVLFWTDDPWPSIWKVAPNGSRPQRILRSKQNAKRPRLSPDGTWIAFDGSPSGRPTMSDFDIQLVHPDGTGLRTVTRSRDLEIDAQWRPDGDTLAFTRMPPTGEWLASWIWTVHADGTGLRSVARGQYARWSPDGAELVLDHPTADSPGDLFLVSADGRRRRLLLASPELDQAAAWSPDGTRILFTRYAGPSGATPSVWVMNADGTAVRRLGPGVAGDFSPDGTQVLYTQDFLGQLYVMNLDGSGKRPVRGAVGSDPQWR
jgi:TolB protein